jgi:hypothetical protein
VALRATAFFGQKKGCHKSNCSTTLRWTESVAENCPSTLATNVVAYTNLQQLLKRARVCERFEVHISNSALQRAAKKRQKRNLRKEQT